MTIMIFPSEGEAMGSDTWTVAEAKAKFSEVIERAQSGGPQTVTKNGRTAVVIVAAEEWERKTKRVGNLAEFFAASPLRGSGIKVKRLKHRVRQVDL
jgi:prevent-host-death family protein